jgi:hypothetical protein
MEMVRTRPSHPRDLTDRCLAKPRKLVEGQKEFLIVAVKECQNSDLLGPHLVKKTVTINEHFPHG